MVSPFAAAVDGFFEGRSWRNRQDDRKRRQEREDTRWDWAKEDREWNLEERDRLRRQGMEDRGWTKEQRERQRAEWERQDAKRKRDEEFREQEADMLGEFWGIGLEDPTKPDPAPANTEAPARDAPRTTADDGAPPRGSVSSQGGIGLEPETPQARTPDRDSAAGGPLRPFDATRDQPRDVGMGGPSTEVIVTENAPDGGYWNIPSVWWDENGDPVRLSREDAARQAAEYEQRTGERFPRFRTPDEGAEVARRRSESGGAQQGDLAISGDAPAADSAPRRQPTAPGEGAPPRSPEGTGGPQPHGRGGAARPPEQRPTQPPSVGLERPAPPDGTPQVQGNETGRFQTMAQEIGASPDMVAMAEQADTAEAALATGTDPRTGRPFEPGAREEVAAFIQNVERRLDSVAPPRGRDALPGLDDRLEGLSRGYDGRSRVQGAALGRLRDEYAQAYQEAETGPAPSVTGATRAQAETEDARQRQASNLGIGLSPETPGTDARPASQPPAQPGAAEPGQRPAVQGPAASEHVAPQQATPTGTPEVSVDSAKGAMTEVGLDGERPTRQQEERVVKAFQDDYQNRRSRDIIRFYLQNGEIEKATAFREFVKQDATRKAMGHWSRAIMAATYNDEKEFVSQLAQAYNTDGYFDDGYSIDPEATGFMRDPSGKVIPGSAQITFTNDRTGESFTQTVEGEGDLYRLGINHLSAEETFERGWEEYQQGRDDRKDAQPKDSDVLKAIELLSGNGEIQPSEEQKAFAELPPSEQFSIAREMLMNERGGQRRRAPPAPGNVPVYGG